MSSKRVNAFCTANIKAAKNACDEIIACCDDVAADGIRIVRPDT